jgi:hypothetical protein
MDGDGRIGNLYYRPVISRFSYSEIAAPILAHWRQKGYMGIF